MGQEMRNNKSPLISLIGFGRACFYACLFTLCQTGMSNVLEERSEVRDQRSVREEEEKIYRLGYA